MQNSNVLCRTCLKKSENAHPITYTCLGYESIDFAIMLMACTSVSIEPNDSLPFFMCEDCVSRLIIAYTFREECEKSDLFLRTHECLKNFKGSDQKINDIDVEGIYDINKRDKIESIGVNEPFHNDKSHNKAMQLNTEQSKINNCPMPKDFFVFHRKIENIPRNIDLKKQSNGKVVIRKYKRRSKAFKCLECDKQFTSKYGLLYHTNLHSGIKTLLCPIENCKRKFFWKPALKRHMQIHSEEKKFLCSLCGKTYNAADSLQHHIKTHTGERPYLCVYCGKTYTQHVHLKYHMRSHSGERPHVCSVCNRSYTRPSHLKKHQSKYCGIGKSVPYQIQHTCNV